MINSRMLDGLESVELNQRLLRPVGFKRHGFFLVLAGLIVLSSSRSAAQEQSAPVSNYRSWDIAVFATGATGEETANSFSQAQIWSGNVFIGKGLTGPMGKGWRSGTIEYGITLIPVLVQTRIQTVHGAGFEPVVLRWNSTHRLGRAIPYIELAGGGVFTGANLPPGDTSDFNFTARGGGGVQLLRGARQSADVGCHWFHISNANLGNKNTEFNGVQISFGYHWFR